MFQQINEAIVRVKGDIYRKKKLEMQHEDFQNELADIQESINRLKGQLKDEKADVKKLEGFSITNFFSSLNGTKYEKLDKENREVLAVQLQLEKAEKTKNEINASIDEIREKIREILDCETEYENLLAEKEKLIIASNLSYADELYAISEQEGNIQAYLKEIREAINAGEAAIKALDNGESALDSAKSWGTWDMFGGGMISSAIKHSKMDEASDHIHVAQYKMRAFQKELLDINEMVEMDLDVSDLLRFADYFFDGFIVDWMVQGRINDSLDQVYINQRKVEKIVMQLKEKFNNLEEKYSSLQNERQALLESL
jgi:hypothetical protein